MHGATAAFGGSGVLYAFDFTTLTPGAVSLAAYGLSLSRTDAANNATVQTDAATLVKGIAADTARCRYDGTRRGLLLEEARTNGVLNCRDMTAAGWSNGSNVTTTGPSGLGAVTAADGTTASCSQANVLSGGFSKYRSSTDGTNTRTASAWLRTVAGTDSWQLDLFGAADQCATGALGTAWQRVSITKPPTTNGFVPVECRNEAANGGTGAQARNQYVDFAQLEVGKFMTSAIVTGASAVTRAGERLYDAAGARLVHGGRLTKVVSFWALGASTDYAADMRLWHVGANDHAEVDAATRAVKVTIGGSLYTTAGTMTWAAFDLVEIFVAAGGGVLPTVVKYRVNGGAAVTLSTGTPPTQGTLTVASTLDLLCNGTANQLSAVVQAMAFYRAGSKPAWA